MPVYNTLQRDMVYSCQKAGRNQKNLSEIDECSALRQRTIGGKDIVDQRWEIIAAKSSRDDSSRGLSFAAHALDTSGMMALLYHRWLPKSVRAFLTNQLFPVEETDAQEKACKWLQLLALLHDIGKVTPAFQNKIAASLNQQLERLCAADLDSSDEEGRGFQHSLAGFAILLQASFPPEFCEIVGIHHGTAVRYSDAKDDYRLHRKNYDGPKSPQESTWEVLRREWIAFALSETGWKDQQIPVPNVRVQMIAAGLLIMADWLASNTEYFSNLPFPAPIDWDNSEGRAEKAWEKLGLPPCWDAAGLAGDEAFQKRFGFLPNATQHAVDEIIRSHPDRGIYIIEAPMGSGKTEAALSAAEILSAVFGCGGLYFGLPTQATANGLFDRFLDWGKTQSQATQLSIRLAHGMAALNSSYAELFHGKADREADETRDALLVHPWLEGKKQVLLSDFVVGTVDQFLMASLKQRHVMLRHLGLSGKVVILDECHAYDAYMSVYLDNTLTWLGAYGVPVILLSATLPRARRLEMVRAYLGRRKMEVIPSADQEAYPVMTYLRGNQVLSRALDTSPVGKKLRVRRLAQEDLVRDLQIRMAGGGCCAVIVNTVRLAQSLARILQREMPGFRVVCFHSRFTAQDRAARESELLHLVGKTSTKEQRNRLIVVGTQVLEQSLDLDFDYMITQLCPMDLLLQRVGRLHRHLRSRPAGLEEAILSVLPADEGTTFVYSRWILYRTDHAILETLMIPGDVPVLVNRVYEEPEGEDLTQEEESLRREYLQQLENEQTRAKEYCMDASRIYSKWMRLLEDLVTDSVDRDEEQAMARVRDTEDTLEVLLLRKIGNFWYVFSDAGCSSAYDPDKPLTREQALALARESLKLPAFFSRGANWERTDRELEPLPQMWQSWTCLSGAKLLVLDEKGKGILLNKKLRYTQEYGLSEDEEVVE